MAAQEAYASSSGFLSFTKTWHKEPYALISPKRPELSAAGKNVVVTGGGSGIGKAVAVAFAQAGAASVAILGRRLERLQVAAADISAANITTKVICKNADATQLKSIDKAFREIAEQVGKIDVLVSGAGVMPQLGKVNGYSAEDFQKGLEGNVMSTFNTVQAFLPLASPNAKLLSLSSGLGHMGPVPNVSTYAVSKAASIKLIEYVAAENPDLHVVDIQPGTVLSDINIASGIPAQDAPELPGHFMVWLASPEAAFLKSRYVWVNWDVEELMLRAKEIEESPSLLRVFLSPLPM